MTEFHMTVLVVAVLLLLASGVNVMREYERAVVLRLGRLVPYRGPGLIFVMPILEKMLRVDMRTTTIDVPAQDVITRDNISVKIDAVLYFRVVEPSRAVIEVENYLYATSLLAQTTMRSVCGQAELDQLLADRDKINDRIRAILDEQTSPWGIKVVTIELKQIDLPQEMQRAMARQAEAERDRRAKIINAEGEYQASTRLAEAAAIMGEHPIAIQLRFLQTLVEIASEHSSTIVLPVPVDLLTPFVEAAGRHAAGAAVKAAASAAASAGEGERVNDSAASALEVEPFWTGELDYRLPEDRIAQVPAERRERSRLMVVDRASSGVEHARFDDIARALPPRALLVANDSKVLRARLRGRKRGSGGAVEALLLGMGDGTIAPAMVRVAKPLHEGQVVEWSDGLTATVASTPDKGRVLLDFSPHDVEAVLERCGELPLPPYIERDHGPTAEDLERYQTVYAHRPGSVAAPTAGLHFTPDLLAGLASSGFEFATVTLHVGPGTFTPVRGDVSEHRMEEEGYDIDAAVASRIAAAKADGRPVVAIGTTTVRALESAADGKGGVHAGPGRSRLFIRPGFAFRVVDGLVTNFHLPGSTLLALVMALAGRDSIRGAYETAVEQGYRFYSYGDAMLIR